MAPPELRGPGAEVLRLIGYPVFREVLTDLKWPADLEGNCEFAIMADPGQESYSRRRRRSRFHPKFRDGTPVGSQRPWVSFTFRVSD